MSDGISINEAMAKWHITQSQAEELDKMDGEQNKTISGNVFDIAKSYYESLENEGIKYGEKEGNTLVDMAKRAMEFVNQMKSKGNVNNMPSVQDEKVQLSPEEAELAKKELNEYLNSYKMAQKQSLEGIKPNVQYNIKSIEDLRNQATYLYNLDEIKELCPELFDLIKE